MMQRYEECRDYGRKGFGKVGKGGKVGGWESVGMLICVLLLIIVARFVIVRQPQQRLQWELVEMQGDFFVGKRRRRNEAHGLLTKKQPA